MKKLFLLILLFPLFLSSLCLAWDAKDFKKTSKSDLKKTLTQLQFNVTQKEDTEPPFKNKYWDTKEDGIYVDIVSGEPLFSSEDKFDSGTGWPSFTRPLEKSNIIEKVDQGFFGSRTEVRSKHADSHLGHVFQDGPRPTGLRYCINSAALKFIPKTKLKEEGYAEYDKLFNQSKVKPKEEVAVFAGGCFWCMQSPFDKFKSKGVISTRVGYTGGDKVNANYSKVSSGITKHLEAIEIKYDSNKISYRELLDVFWKNIDPFDELGQFCDKGNQYKSAVFYKNDSQKKDFESSLIEIKKKLSTKNKISVALNELDVFYSAEEYHQSYYLKNPIRYKYYRYSCGRDKRLKQVWSSKN